ncbi:MAG TPA: hypothetical protein VFV86_04215 [Nitrososphaeraceae archaeon]|nr:hypothetical protein [Nitrososphaeraceae archaeon]
MGIQLAIRSLKMPWVWVLQRLPYNTQNLFNINNIQELIVALIVKAVLFKNV